MEQLKDVLGHKPNLQESAIEQLIHKTQLKLNQTHAATPHTQLLKARVEQLETQLLNLSESVRDRSYAAPAEAAQKLDQQQAHALRNLLALAASPAAAADGGDDDPLALCGDGAAPPLHAEVQLLGAERKRWSSVDERLDEGMAAVKKGLDHAVRTHQQTQAVQSLSKSSVDQVIEDEASKENATGGGAVAHLRRATQLQLLPASKRAKI